MLSTCSTRSGRRRPGRRCSQTQANCRSCRRAFCALDTEGGCVLAVGRVAAIELVRLAGRRVKKVVILAPARTQQPPQN